MLAYLKLQSWFGLCSMFCVQRRSGFSDGPVFGLLTPECVYTFQMWGRKREAVERSEMVSAVKSRLVCVYYFFCGDGHLCYVCEAGLPQSLYLSNLTAGCHIRQGRSLGADLSRRADLQIWSFTLAHATRSFCPLCSTPPYIFISSGHQ